MTSATQWNWPLLRTRCQREARRLLRNPDDAEEAAQEALTRAWRKRDTCRTPRTPVPWVIQITRNEAFRLMGRRREELSAQPGRDEGESAGAPSAEELVARADLRRAVSRLPTDERVVLYLRYEEDLKQKRIAELLDIPEGTVKVRLYRARERLRVHLTDEPEGNNPPK